VTQRGDDREADRSAAEHKGHLAGFNAGLVDRVQADRHRLGQRRMPRVQPVRHGQQQRRGKQHPLGVPANRGVGREDRVEAGGRQQHR
jgi:hypothetical protein